MTMNRTGICHLLELKRIQYATGRLTMTVINGDQQSDEWCCRSTTGLKEKRLRHSCPGVSGPLTEKNPGVKKL